MESAVVDLARRAALRARLSTLHVAAVFVGAECVLVWAVFRWSPAAIVGGIAGVVGGVLALFAYPRRLARSRREILTRALRTYVYSTALILVGALLVRDGARASSPPEARSSSGLSRADTADAPCIAAQS